MAGFNMADYEPVETRLARAHADRDDLRIITELVMHDDKAVIYKATIYKTGDDLEHNRPWATGWAQESIGSSNITRTSWLEVCETSAIGRALANAGYAPKGARASREEMQKASRPTAKVGGRPAQGKQPEARQQDGPPSAHRSALEQASLDQLAAYVRDYFDLARIDLGDVTIRTAVRETATYLAEVAPSRELTAVVDALTIVLAAHG